MSFISAVSITLISFAGTQPHFPCWDTCRGKLSRQPGLLHGGLMQVPVLAGDAADNAMKRLPQIQTHSAAQHALADISCMCRCGCSEQSQSSRSELWAPSIGARCYLGTSSNE